MKALVHALVFTVAATSTVALVVPRADAAPAQEGQSEAQRLYLDGKTHYEVGEYEEALELWKQAYAKVDDTAENLQVRHALVYNIAEAEAQVFQINKDITHLRRAKTLLDRYLSNHETLYGGSEDAAHDRADAQTKLEEIEGLLAEAESEATPKGGNGDGSTAATAAEGPNLEQMKAERLQAIRADPALHKKDKLYSGLIWGGAAVTVVGGVLVVSAGGTEAATEVPTARFLNSAGGAVAGSGLVLAAGGIAMFAVGVVKRKKHRAPPPGQLAVTPYGSPQGFGASARLRF